MNARPQQQVQPIVAAAAVIQRDRARPVYARATYAQLTRPPLAPRALSINRAGRNNYAPFVAKCEKDILALVKQPQQRKCSSMRNGTADAWGSARTSARHDSVPTGTARAPLRMTATLTHHRPLTNM